jgi:predicted small lipoprotein YifL
MRAALIALALAACGDDGGVGYPDAAAAADANLAIDAAPARETIIATQPLQPGELVEGIMHGGSGDTALIHLSAPSAKLDWNIHSHSTGHAVTVFEDVGKMTVDYPFTPPGDGDWYLLVRNGGTVDMDVKVEVRLYGAMTWVWE